MNNSVLEAKLTAGGLIQPDSNVIFDEQVLFPPGIGYDNKTGIVTFGRTGLYSFQWWVATETTLKGAVVFHMLTSQGGIIPGNSPIKTGQVAGFGTIDVQTAGATMSLVNKSLTHIVISRKTGTKGYLVIAPIAPVSSPRVYRGDLSASGSVIEAPLGNGLNYRLENASSTYCRLVLTPMNGPTYYDYRRLSAFEGTSLEGDYTDNGQITGAITKDPTVYNNSREMHWVLIRVQNPVSKLWSTYEVRFFLSGGMTRATMWVNVIEEEVSYA